MTAFVRFADPLRSILDGKMEARIELYAFDQATTVRVGQGDVPLESEPTAVLGYWLEGAPVWDHEIAGFRFAEPPILADGLIMVHPTGRDESPSYSCTARRRARRGGARCTTTS